MKCDVLRAYVRHAAGAPDADLHRGDPAVLRGAQLRHPVVREPVVARGPAVQLVNVGKMVRGELGGRRAR